jgi:hypothetical protein
MTAIRLDGAAVAVTGGARGIGLATAKAFAAKGAHVYIGDLDEHLAEEAAAHVGGHGFALDVRSKASFAAFLAAVDTPLAVLVNNAGIMPAGRFVDEDDAITDAIIDINVKGVLHGTKLALPGMLERGSGHIVNVASYAGKFPAAGLATYCTSKHAVVGFSESLRDELAATDVTVTAVLPSAVRTTSSRECGSAGCCPPSTPSGSPTRSSPPVDTDPRSSPSQPGYAATRLLPPSFPTGCSAQSAVASPATAPCVPSTEAPAPATTHACAVTRAPLTQRKPMRQMSTGADSVARVR